MVATGARLQPLVLVLLRLVVIVECLAIYVPAAPILPVTSLDSGWAFALNAADARGLVFGRDIIFTFGPYSSTYTHQYSPATDFQMLWSGLFLAITVAVALILIAGDRHAIWAALLPVFMAIVSLDTYDAIFLAIPLCYLTVLCRSEMPGGLASALSRTLPLKICVAWMIVALSLISLIKQSFATAAVAVIALGVVLLIVRRKVLAAVLSAMLYLLGIVGLWVAARQPLFAVFHFFLAQGSLVRGYTDAMSTPGDAWKPLTFLVCCATISIMYVRTLPKARYAGVVLAIGMAAVMFCGFKAGFVRSDSLHVLIAAGLLGVATWIVALGQNGFMPFVALYIGIFGWGLIDYSETRFDVSALVGRIETSVVHSTEGLVSRIRYPRLLESEFNDNLALIRETAPLPRLSGSTDIYSFGQSLLLAHDLAWDPRPVFQSYAAFTPELELVNADHLMATNAPDNILFSIQPIDGRLPSLEDGASWPALFTRYRFTQLRNDMAVLRKRSVVSASDGMTQTPLFSGDVKLGESIDLPANVPFISATLDVRLTLLGRLVSFAYKPPPLSITYTFADGHTEKFRYIAGMGATGFVVAPVVESAADFVAIALPNAAQYFAARRPRSFMIDAAEGSGSLWASTVRAAFYAVRARPQPVGPLLFDPVQRREAGSVGSSTTSDCVLEAVDGHPILALPLQIGEFFQAAGWAAISAKSGVAPDATVLTLTAKNGRAIVIKTRNAIREDVNRAFNRPGLGPVGFVASTDLGDAVGDYTLGIDVSRRGKTWTCKQQLPVHINRSPIAVTAATPAVIEGVPVRRMVPLPRPAVPAGTTADCTIDIIDADPIGLLRPRQLGKWFKIQGWAAVSIKAAIAPYTTTVTLTSPSGNVWGTMAKIVPRDDVKRYFGKPELGPVGFIAAADLTGMSGDYTLGVLLARGRDHWVCAQTLPVHVAGARE